MRATLALAFACLAGAAFAAEGPRAPGAFKLEIGAGKVHEECTRLEKGERRRFTWRTDVPVDFNIHYHEGSEVFYPLKREGAKRGRGTFRAKIAQEYCWMWTAKRAAKLEGRIVKPGQT